jgi:hypothetical protein
MDFVGNEKKRKLVNKLLSMAKSRDFEINQTDAEIEISNALLEYYNDRHYTPTEENPYEDIYEGIILQLALSSVAKMGAEGENYHSEGGVIRTYDSGDYYPASLTKKIIPLAKGVG